MTPPAAQQAAPAETPAPDTSELDLMIRDTNKAHTEQKKANNAYEKARKALYKYMKDKGIKSHTVEGVVKLEAELARSKVSGIDVLKLESLVGADKVKPHLSISKTVVEDKFGNEIAEECTVVTEGNENVTIKVA
jgi:hypothetical protein